jgi:formate-dependent nitrite reductase membrane component NrfD
MHHLMGLHGDDADDARHLGALTLRLEAVLPTRIDAAHAVTESLETLDELVGRGEAALAVLLALTTGLLIALVHGAPLAGARDVHALFDAELTATASADTTLARRLFAISLVPDAYAGTGGLARIDVVTRVAAAYRLEDAGAIAARGTGNAPTAIRVGRHALVTHEAILG